MTNHTPHPDQKPAPTLNPPKPLEQVRLTETDQSDLGDVLARWRSGQVALDLAGYEVTQALVNELCQADQIRNISFAKASFGDGDVSFRGASFGDGDVSFEDASFGDGDVSFRGASFGDGDVSFEDATFGDGDVSFRGAEFGNGFVSFRGASFGDGNVTFARASFGDGDVTFVEASFGDGFVSFSGASFGDGNVTFARASFGDGDVTFVEASFGDGFVSFSDASFGDGDVWFVDASFGDGNVSFEDASFGDGDVTFDFVTFGDGNVSFRDASFGDGDVWFRDASFGDGDVSFEYATFGEGSLSFTGVGPLPSGKLSAEGDDGGCDHSGVRKLRVSLTRCVFGGLNEISFGVREGSGLQLEADLSGSRFGETVLAAANATVDLSRVTVRGPFEFRALAAMSGDPDGSVPPRLKALHRADITSRFRIGRGVNLAETVWGDHDLGRIELAATTTLKRSTRPKWFLMPWRGAGDRRVLGGDRRVLAGDEGAETAPEVSAAVLERNYRDLRKSLESAGNYDGASDFFYGELQARRRQLDRWSPQRALLATYHLISEYGTRAWRSLIAWIAITLLSARLLIINGIDIDHPNEYLGFGDVWRFTLSASMSLFRPLTAPELSLTETGIATVVRIIGPAMLALTALSIRNQTKR